MKTTHMTDIRLKNNAGMSIPVCVAARKGPLDCDASGWAQVKDKNDATCKNCRRIWPKRYDWAPLKGA